MPITKATASAIAPAAKGDLVVGSATNDAAVLGVGSADQVLTVDSSTATGLKWATPSAGGMTLLSTTTLSGTKTTISGISSAYTNLYILIYGMTNATTAGNFRVQPNDNLNSTYVRFDQGNNASNQIQDNLIFLNASATSVLNTGGNNVWQLTIFNYASSTIRKTFIGSGLFENTTPSNQANILGGGISSTTAISSLAFTMSNSTAFNGGTVLIYGVK